eukprot:351306-Amphidinium_carterae.1
MGSVCALWPNESPKGMEPGRESAHCGKPVASQAVLTGGLQRRSADLGALEVSSFKWTTPTLRLAHS